MPTTSNDMVSRKPVVTKHFEIDQAILDFLIFEATKALFRSERSKKPASTQGAINGEVATHLDLVDSFLLIFKEIHQGARYDAEISLRLRLLRFAVLFTQRQSTTNLGSWKPQLRTLRRQRRKDAEAYSDRSSVPDLNLYLRPSSDIIDPRKKEVQGPQNGQIAADQSSRETSRPSISLLDVLPSFMALSAAELALQEGSQITTTWMRLAAGFMAQAVIEQYLVYRSRRDEIVEEAFAWGFDPEAASQEGTDAFLLNAMFFDDSGEFAEWNQIKEEHMSALIPPAGQDLLDHFESLRADELSLRDFNRRILAFLEALAQNLPKPFLAQINWSSI